MAGSATVQLYGNLGSDPEVKFLDGGKAVAKFSVAVNGYKKDAEPSWFNVSVFGKSAENCGTYLKKGKPVLVTGRIEVRKYQAKDGNKGVSVDVIAENVTFVGSKDDAPAQSGGAVGGPSADDLPF